MFTLALLVAGGVAIIKLIQWMGQPVHRTREDVIGILKRVLETGGDREWDDFVSIHIAEPNLEKIRRRCSDVTLQPTADFEHVIREILAELSSVR